MQSPALQAVASIPPATARVAMSRSVTTPSGLRCSSTTGINPQSLSTIICATCCNGVSRVQQAGLAVITLFSSITGSWLHRGTITVPQPGFP